jgi:hypothetical protein
LLGWNVGSAQRKLSLLAETATWTEEMKQAYQDKEAERAARKASGTWPLGDGELSLWSYPALMDGLERLLQDRPDLGRSTADHRLDAV